MVEARAVRSSIAIDAAVFTAIALVVVVTNRPFVRSALRFDDASWLFHFGHRVLRGDVPYRDFDYHQGPLPLYVDAAFQRLFGAKYFASLYAALVIKTLRVFVTWKLAGRVAGLGAAAGIVVFCCLDPTFSYGHHASLPYVELSIAFAALALISPWPPRLRFGVAGASIGLGALALPGVAIVAAAMFVIGTGAVVARERAGRDRLVAGTIGLAAAAVICVVGVGWSQVTIDVDPLAVVLGRGASDPNPWWVRWYVFLGIPVLVTGTVFWLAARREELSMSAVALVAMPALVIGGLLMRYALLDVALDLPRVLLVVVIVTAWFGVEPRVALPIGGLALALPSPTPSLLATLIVVLLSSRHLGLHHRRIVGWGAAAVAIVHLLVAARAGAELYAIEGVKHVRDEVHIEDPAFAGLRATSPQKSLATWLATTIAPGSTCFVAGNAPILYDLLRCTNPTRMDVTSGALPVALFASPPDYLIVHDTTGLEGLLEGYELVGTAERAMGPEIAQLAARDVDGLASYRLYRRRW